MTEVKSPLNEYLHSSSKKTLNPCEIQPLKYKMTHNGVILKWLIQSRQNLLTVKTISDIQSHQLYRGIFRIQSNIGQAFCEDH